MRVGASASVFAPELPVSLENAVVPRSPDVQAEQEDIVVASPTLSHQCPSDLQEWRTIPCRTLLANESMELL